MNLDDKFGSGQTSFGNTGVIYADKGIKGLTENVPMAQNEWLFATSGTQTRTEVLDASTKRVMTRVTGVAGASEDATLHRRILLPKNHGAVVTATMTLYGPSGAADAGVTAVTIKPGLGGTFEQFLMTPSGVYAPSDFLTIKIDVTTDTAGHYLDVCDIELASRSKIGNI
jgi:hypothetical protein